MSKQQYGCEKSHDYRRQKKAFHITFFSFEVTPNLQTYMQTHLSIHKATKYGTADQPKAAP